MLFFWLVASVSAAFSLLWAGLAWAVSILGLHALDYGYEPVANRLFVSLVIVITFVFQIGFFYSLRHHALYKQLLSAKRILQNRLSVGALLLVSISLLIRDLQKKY